MSLRESFIERDWDELKAEYWKFAEVSKRKYNV
jgi:hypothetical protein